MPCRFVHAMSGSKIFGWMYWIDHSECKARHSMAGQHKHYMQHVRHATCTRCTGACPTRHSVRMRRCTKMPLYFNCTCSYHFQKIDKISQFNGIDGYYKIPTDHRPEQVGTRQNYSYVSVITPVIARHISHPLAR